MKRKTITFVLFLLVIVSTSTYAQSRNLPQRTPTVSCTSAVAGTTPTSDTCSGTIFQFPVIFGYSDGSKTQVVLESAMAYGICQANYPACDINLPVIAVQLSPPTVQSFNVTFSGTSATVSYIIKQPTITEAGSCSCPTDADPTAYPNGFAGFEDGQILIQETENVACPQ